MAEGRLRVGVVGTGFGTAVQIPGFQAYPRTEVVAVVSAHEARARAAAARFGVAHAYTDYDAFLEQPDLDAVSITSPPHTHHAMTLAALRAGKHVLCEKPFAMNQDEAEELLAEAQRVGVAAMVDHEFRWTPQRAYAQRLLSEGYLGDVRTVAITMFSGAPAFRERPWTWWADREQGGGLLGALGSHVIDAIRVWFGEFAGVFGQLDTWITDRRTAAGSFKPVTADDAYAFMARLQNGALVTVSSSFVAPHGPGMRVQAYGTRGALELRPDGTLQGGQRDDPAMQPLPIPDAFYRRDLLGDGKDARLMPFIALVEQFCGWALDGRRAAPSFEDGVRNQRVADAIVRSQHEGRWVAV